MTNTRHQAVEALQARIGHRFADQPLLDRALTHSSVGAGARKPPDNERLEFLGDRVLGLIMADHLVGADSEATAGALSSRLAGLVSRQACARVAREIGLGAALRLPGGETRRGGRDHESILADACEALIAALYVELGLESAAALVLRMWAPLTSEPFDRATSDPKSALQEWAAAQGHPPPVYATVGRSGPDHAPVFTIEARVGDLAPARAEGASLQSGQKLAALALLRRETTPK